MNDVTVRIIDENGDAVVGAGLIEDAIQALFDECDQLDIYYNIAVEQLHWGITRAEVSPSVADGANTAFK